MTALHRFYVAGPLTLTVKAAELAAALDADGFTIIPSYGGWRPSNIPAGLVDYTIEVAAIIEIVADTDGMDVAGIVRRWALDSGEAAVLHLEVPVSDDLIVVHGEAYLIAV